ncbi:MAG: hypothetical protein QOE38_1876 [Thermoleophilaceae bacterium]|nr:hypothetical protein [Thermoleophilaceae bacterium]
MKRTDQRPMRQLVPAPSTGIQTTHGQFYALMGAFHPLEIGELNQSPF